MSLIKEALHAYEEECNETCTTLEELCEWLDKNEETFAGLKVEGEVKGYEKE